MTPPTKDTVITVRFTDEAAEAIRALAELHDCSQSEILRRAVSMMKFVNVELTKGSEFIVRNSNGSTERLTWLWS